MAEDGRIERARRQREERRQQLLDAGLAVFSRKGYHDTSITDLVEAAGVARGTFYLYFGSKAALFEILVDQLLGELEAGITRVDLSPGAPPPQVQLRDNVLWLLSLPSARPQMLQLLFWEAVGVDEAADEKLDSFHRRMFALTEHSLELGMAMGLVRECHTEVTARALVGMVKEVLMSMLLRQELEEVDLDALADELLGIATRGILRLGVPA